VFLWFPNGKPKWPPGDSSSKYKNVRIFKYSSFKTVQISLIPALCICKEPSIILSLFSLCYFSCKAQWLELEILGEISSSSQPPTTPHHPCFSKSLIALPESYLQENSPSRALRLLFSKKALLFAVISEANSRLGAKHASLLLRRSLSKHTERIWKVRSSDAEVRHFSYGTALKTLELHCYVSVHVCFVLEILHSPSFWYCMFAWDSLV